jgi:hypothetical protein
MGATRTALVAAGFAWARAAYTHAVPHPRRSFCAARSHARHEDRTRDLERPDMDRPFLRSDRFGACRHSIETTHAAALAFLTADEQPIMRFAAKSTAHVSGEPFASRLTDVVPFFHGRRGKKLIVLRGSAAAVRWRDRASAFRREQAGRNSWSAIRRPMPPVATERASATCEPTSE